MNSTPILIQSDIVTLRAVSNGNYIFSSAATSLGPNLTRSTRTRRTASEKTPLKQNPAEVIAFGSVMIRPRKGATPIFLPRADPYSHASDRFDLRLSVRPKPAQPRENASQLELDGDRYVRRYSSGSLTTGGSSSGPRLPRLLHPRHHRGWGLAAATYRQ